MTTNTGFAALFKPTVAEIDGYTVNQFRGIKYGSVSQRFSDPEPVSPDAYTKDLDCTQFGPICPQVSTEFHHLLRIPEEVRSQEPPLTQDEFQCLNLDVTAPAKSSAKLPVMIWIHGGSQVMTFMPSSSPCADVVPLVAASMKQEQPMIVVFVNYRLNILAFGDGSGSKNLALKDQRLGIDWVVEHIGDFGGDATNITLAGESAGAVYVHAHVATGAPVQRAILQSGSLYLSPPQGDARGQTLIESLEKSLAGEGLSLAKAPVEALLKTLARAKVVSLWLQLTEELQGWETRSSHVQELIIGDVEYESVIWRNGIEDMTASEIVSCFDSATDRATELKALYNIIPDRPTACKLGALDLINDTRFALPTMELRDAYRKGGATVYDYVWDEANPWQASNRAHHAVDLTMLFGTLDLTHNPGANTVRKDARSKWVSFCNGKAPWSKAQTYAFGPYGNHGEISTDEYKCRRRVRACGLLREMGPQQYNAVFAKLAAGRISLLN